MRRSVAEEATPPSTCAARMTQDMEAWDPIGINQPIGVSSFKPGCMQTLLVIQTCNRLRRLIKIAHRVSLRCTGCAHSMASLTSLCIAPHTARCIPNWVTHVPSSWNGTAIDQTTFTAECGVNGKCPLDRFPANSHLLSTTKSNWNLVLS